MWSTFLLYISGSLLGRSIIARDSVMIIISQEFIAPGLNAE